MVGAIFSPLKNQHEDQSVSPTHTEAAPLAARRTSPAKYRELLAKRCLIIWRLGPYPRIRISNRVIQSGRTRNWGGRFTQQVLDLLEDHRPDVVLVKPQAVRLAIEVRFAPHAGGRPVTRAEPDAEHIRQ